MRLSPTLSSERPFSHLRRLLQCPVRPVPRPPGAIQECGPEPCPASAVRVSLWLEGRGKKTKTRYQNRAVDAASWDAGEWQTNLGGIHKKMGKLFLAQVPGISRSCRGTKPSGRKKKKNKTGLWPHRQSCETASHIAGQSTNYTLQNQGLLTPALRS